MRGLSFVRGDEPTRRRCGERHDFVINRWLVWPSGCRRRFRRSRGQRGWLCGELRSDAAGCDPPGKFRAAAAMRLSSRPLPGFRGARGRRSRCDKLDASVLAVWRLARVLAWCGFAVAACGPSEIATISGGGSSSTGFDVVSSSESGTTFVETALDPDEQLCVDLCLGIAGSDCTRADETCFGWCMARLEYESDCPDELRTAIACETVESLDATCRAAAGCDAEYKALDFCRGTCSHGNSSGGGSSQTDCAWAVEDCYGHEFSTTCYTGDDDSLCVCFADDELLDTCNMGYGIKPFSGCEKLSIFTTCCRDLYEEVLFP